MLDQLRMHMAMLRREELITEWYDREIEAGSEWRDEIECELEAADVILLLVSANFLASDFCYEKEMTRAVERARRGEALVIGVMLRPVNGWDDSPFAEFQVVPRDARPISKWSNQDEAYADVVQRIQAALKNRPAAVSSRRPQKRRSPTHHTSPRAGTDQSAQSAEPPATEPDEQLLTDAELAMLDMIADPDQREMRRQEMIMQKKAFIDQMSLNMAQTRRDIRKAVAQNLRAETTDKPNPDS
jgi:TIR domain